MTGDVYGAGASLRLVGPSWLPLVGHATGFHRSPVHQYGKNTFDCGLQDFKQRRRLC
jgi:hypothetical protein